MRNGTHGQKAYKILLYKTFSYFFPLLQFFFLSTTLASREKSNEIVLYLMIHNNIYTGSIIYKLKWQRFHCFPTIFRSCPDGFVCLPHVGDNPNYGFTSFDNLLWSMLTTFQLITLDYWENVYNMVRLKSVSKKKCILVFIKIKV